MKKTLLIIALIPLFLISACSQDEQNMSSELLHSDMTDPLKSEQYDILTLVKAYHQIGVVQEPNGTWSLKAKSSKEANISRSLYSYLQSMIAERNSSFLKRNRVTRSESTVSIGMKSRIFTSS